MLFRQMNLGPQDGTMPNLGTILAFIISESSNGCTDPRSAWEYIQRVFKLNQEQLRALKPFLDSLNYHALREYASAGGHWEKFFQNVDTGLTLE